MSTIYPLDQAIQTFAKMDEQDFAEAEHLFEKRTFKKGTVESIENTINRGMSYITKGLVRCYYIDPKTGKEINSYFFQEAQFMVSFFIVDPNTPSNYYVETLEDTEIDYIRLKDLTQLYKSSHQWEHFGRVLAETYYRGANARTENFIFNTPEERYLQLIKDFPKIFQRTSLINIASYLGVESQSLSRIRKRIAKSH